MYFKSLMSLIVKVKPKIILKKLQSRNFLSLNFDQKCTKLKMEFNNPGKR